MQITVEDKSSVKKVLHIEVPESQVVDELNSAYGQLKKTAKIKGFRPGKAPRSVLERMFKKDVHADVASKLVQNSFIQALKEKQLNIVGQPDLTPPALEGKGPYQYDVEIEIQPEISDIEFKGLALKKTIYKTDESEVNNQLEMLQKNMAKLIPIEEERPAQEGDSVIIDFEGFKDGKPLPEAQKTENFTLKIGSGTISKEFNEQLVGMQPGEEKTFDVDFPEDHASKTIAGATLRFEVKLKEIRQEVLPPLDDELAKQLGQYESLEALKTDIEKNIQNGYDKRTEQELNEQIFKLLIDKTDFEVPDTLVNYELEGIIEEAERSFAQKNITMEQLGQSREKLAEMYRGTAEKQVRRHLILDKIVSQENLTLTDEELDKGFEEMGQAFNQPKEAIAAYYKEQPDRLGFFKHTLLEKKAIKLIIENSDIEEIEGELEEGK